MPLIRDVAVCQKLWKDALDQPFDAAALAALKERYDRARRQDATYRALYKEQRAIYLAELRAMQEAKRAELAVKPKSELMLLADTRNKNLTKADLIESLIWSSVSVETEHDRVQRIWAAMSDAEREGQDC
jgi:hypothetical protein